MPKLSGSMLEEALGILRGAKKEGSMLYRYDRNIPRLFDKGISEDFAQLPKFSTVEPRGIYFADSISDIPTLLEPTNTQAIKPWVRNDKRYLAGTKFDITDPERDFSKFGLVQAAIDPKEVADFGDPKKWRDFVMDIGKGYYSENSVENALKGRENLDLLPEKLHSNLSRMGYSAVRFPDLAADQPHIKQVAIFKPGKTIIKSGKEVALIGAAGASAIPLSQRLGLRPTSKFDISGDDIE